MKIQVKKTDLIILLVTILIFVATLGIGLGFQGKHPKNLTIVKKTKLSSYQQALDILDEYPVIDG